MEDRVINNKFNIEAILRYAYPRELKHFKDEESLEILLNNIVEANRGNRPNCPRGTTYYYVRYINLNNSTLPSQIKSAFLDGMFLWRDEDSEKLKETLHLMKVFDLNELSKKLFEEIKNNNLNAIKVLITKGANVNQTNDDGITPLSAALYSDIYKKPNFEIVKLLVENGADVNAKDDKRENVSQMTPLSKSIYEDNLEIAKYLIDNGADVTAKDSDGLTPLHWICNKRKDYKNNDKNIEIYEFAKMLIEKGADVNAEKEFSKETPLFLAIRKSEIDYMNIMKLLIENGANVNHKNENETTPLMAAAESLNISAIKLLFENGADINAKDRFGSTALNYANGVIVLDTTNKNKDKQIMDFLIEKGAKRGTTTITEKLKYDKALECEDYLDKLETQNKPKIKEKSKSKTKSKSNDFGIGM